MSIKIYLTENTSQKSANTLTRKLLITHNISHARACTGRMTTTLKAGAALVCLIVSYMYT